jgi:hypothetical protein
VLRNQCFPCLATPAPTYPASSGLHSFPDFHISQGWAQRFFLRVPVTSPSDQVITALKFHNPLLPAGDGLGRYGPQKLLVSILCYWPFYSG